MCFLWLSWNQITPISNTCNWNDRFWRIIYVCVCMCFFTNIHGPQTTYPNDFGDSPLPPRGWHLWIWNVSATIGRNVFKFCSDIYVPHRIKCINFGKSLTSNSIIRCPILWFMRYFYIRMNFEHVSILTLAFSSTLCLGTASQSRQLQKRCLTVRDRFSFFANLVTNSQKLSAEIIMKMEHFKSLASKSIVAICQTSEHTNKEKLVGLQWIHLLAEDREKYTNKPNLSNGSNLLNPLKKKFWLDSSKASNYHKSLKPTV